MLEDINTYVEPPRGACQWYLMMINGTTIPRKGTESEHNRDFTFILTSYIVPYNSEIVF